MNSRDWLSWWVILLLFSGLLLPPLRTPQGLPDLRLGELLAVLFLIHCAARASSGKTVILEWGARQYALLGMLPMLIISIIIGSVLGYNAKFTDLMEIFKFVKYIIIYTIFVTFTRQSSGSDNYKINIFGMYILFLWGLAVIVVQQYFDLLQLNDLYIQYISPTAYMSLVGNHPHPRPVGVFGNPSVLGYVFAIGAIVSIYKTAVEKKNVYYILSFAMCISCIGMSMSRSSLGALLAAVLYFSIYLILLSEISLLGKFKIMTPIMSVTSIALVAVIFSNQLFEAIGWRLYTIINFDSTAGWQARLHKIQDNFQLFLESPIFGVGPIQSDAAVPDAADNEWLLLLRTYGIAGTFILLAGILWPHVKAIRSLLRACITSILVATAVYMVPSAVFHSLSLMPLLLAIIAVEDTTTKPIRVF